MAALSHADVLSIPEVVHAILHASMGLRQGSTTWDDWPELDRAQDRLITLSQVCRAWRAPGRRMAAEIWIVDEEEMEDGGIVDQRDAPSDPEAVRTLVLPLRWPWETLSTLGVDGYQYYIDMCPNLRTLYSHKPPLGLHLPPGVTTLYTTGLPTSFTQGALVAPQLAALSFLQLNDTPLLPRWLTGEDVVRAITRIGCGQSLRHLAIDLNVVGEDYSGGTTALRAISQAAPRLRSLMITPETIRTPLRDYFVRAPLRPASDTVWTHFTTATLDVLAIALNDLRILTDLLHLTYRVDDGNLAAAGADRSELRATCDARGIRLLLEPRQVRKTPIQVTVIAHPRQIFGSV